MYRICRAQMALSKGGRRSGSQISGFIAGQAFHIRGHQFSLEGSLRHIWRITDYAFKEKFTRPNAVSSGWWTVLEVGLCELSSMVSLSPLTILPPTLRTLEPCWPATPNNQGMVASANSTITSPNIWLSRKVRIWSVRHGRHQLALCILLGLHKSSSPVRF